MTRKTQTGARQAATGRSDGAVAERESALRKVFGKLGRVRIERSHIQRNFRYSGSQVFPLKLARDLQAAKLTSAKIADDAVLRLARDLQAAKLGA